MATIEVDKNDKSLGYDTLNLTQAAKALKYSLVSNQPINLIGPPGIGKTAIVAAAIEGLDMSLLTFILSLCDPTDIGGMPVVGVKCVNRIPFEALKMACDAPHALFFDELTCAPPPVQAASLRVILERYVGDYKLHPGTRIIAASNPPDQAAGGYEQSLPLLSRLTQIKVLPTVEEVQNYFFQLGSEGSTLRTLAVDFAATLEMAPDLLALEPPSGTVASGKPWGNPRSYERGLKVCASAIDGGESDTSPIFAACLSGNVGDDAAAGFMTIRKIRDQLPSKKEIEANPMSAKLPQDVNSAIAVLGVLAQVCQTDPCPANIYADRLQHEVRMAATRSLGRYKMSDYTKSPYYKEGIAARNRLLQTLGKAMNSL